MKKTPVFKIRYVNGFETVALKKKKSNFANHCSLFLVLN